MLGSIGMPELILIFIVALIVFGPKKLPEIGKSLGKGLAEFKKASDDFKQSIQKEVDGLKEETRLEHPVVSAGPVVPAPPALPGSPSDTPVKPS
jgi:sec-independent protein translocase protein TatA